MEYLSPHESVPYAQLVHWSDLPLEKSIKFLFLDYFKCVTVDKNNGIYTFYYAIAENDVDEVGIKKGDKIMFSVAYRTFQKAIYQLPKSMSLRCRKEYAEGKNLYIDFRRTSPKFIKIDNQSVKEPTQEQLIEAENQYRRLKEDIAAQKKEDKRIEESRKKRR